MPDPSGFAMAKVGPPRPHPLFACHNYSGSVEGAWEQYLQELKLPPEFKVLGVNDYIFIEGYRKLRKAKDNGRLKNISLLLPVIELRLDKFGGSRSPLSKVNFHIIFSNEVEADLMRNNSSMHCGRITSSHLITQILKRRGKQSPRGRAL